MKVIVFGATGSVGRLAVESLLADGHEVTAFARRPNALEVAHPQLYRLAGDALDFEDVCSAVEGHDAVVVTLGGGASRKSVVRSKGTELIVRAMQHHGVERLICQSTLGAGESWNNLNFFWKRVMFGVLLRSVFLDHERQEQLVRVSGLDWTIVRPGAFTDAPADGNFKVDIPSEERGLRLKISRADIAGFLAACVRDNTFVHRAVGISH
ncbi:epimerase [Halioglobus japonicus]|uniref:Epimerase n=1 Tax=Halioglobus japonicus TaxID=930805 RepID=A0AAP8MEL0_9GAMM|nr:SDR family oxidoreductase [Halioglobus japonicus]AQA18395.1 epimerase [Halioglobus japonicus]PLW86411.1 epimerase [Halioglobus japonicus]GHD13009.1 hypothetical protein GCM10007052_14670 [Halioglobus japonicus]